MASTQRCLSKGNKKYLYLNDEDLDDNAILSIKHDFYEMVSEYYKKNLASNNVCLESVGSIMKILISNEVAPDYITKISGWDETQSCFEIKVEDCLIEKIDGKNRLFHSTSGIIKELIPWETSFEVVWKIHLENDHPEPPKLKEVLDAKYIYNTYVTECINAVCPVCASREKPNARISLYLVYMGGNGDFAFRYVMVYQDLLTNFIQLRPICTELMQKDITLELLQIFTDFGPPIYIEISEIAFKEPIDAVMGLLQFFKYTVIHMFKKDITKNEGILSILTEWMSETHCLNWGIGCLMMQWKLNNEVSKDGKTSFAKVFAPEVEGKTAAKRKYNRTQDLNTALEKASKSSTSLVDNNEIIIKEQFSIKLESQSPKENSGTQNSASDSEDDYYLSKFLLCEPGPSNQSDITLDSQSSSNSVPINDPLKFEPDSDDDDDL